ncbi:MAG: hypothetical protein M5U08_23315 [Burkholderiales bacterium]|nr:hypothetical protein [Burkholderiales bacterium]
MSASEIAAWVGAATGSLALLWDIIKWSKTGPRIAVTAAPNMTGYGAAELILGNKPCVLVEACNVGDGKTTITHLVGFYYDSWLKRLFRRKPTTSIAVLDPSPGKVPHVLDKGERWVGMMEQNEELIRMSQDGYLFCGVYHSTSKRPVLARLVIPTP